MKIGHILLADAGNGQSTEFIELVEALDRLAIDQHVLVADAATARRLDAAPYVTVGPVVRSPVMACCLMPTVDVVHIHDDKSGQAGLLLTLTRSTPYVVTSGRQRRGRLHRSVLKRAQYKVAPGIADPETLVATYRKAIDRWSELPENTNSR